MIETQATPILCAMVVIRHPDTGHVLMLRRHRDDGYDPWDLNWGFPGGRVVWGESPDGYAVEELREAVAVRIVRPLELVGVSSRIAGNAHLISLVYLATEWIAPSGGPVNAAPHRYDRLEWVDPQRAPGLLLPGADEVLQWLRTGRIL